MTNKLLYPDSPLVFSPQLAQSLKKTLPTIEAATAATLLQQIHYSSYTEPHFCNLPNVTPQPTCKAAARETLFEAQGMTWEEIVVLGGEP